MKYLLYTYRDILKTTNSVLTNTRKYTDFIIPENRNQHFDFYSYLYVNINKKMPSFIIQSAHENFHCIFIRDAACVHKPKQKDAMLFLGIVYDCLLMGINQYGVGQT
jgi:hypothetical protein